MSLFHRVLGLKLPPAKETAEAIQAEAEEELEGGATTTDEHLLTLHLGLLPNGNTNIYFSWKEDSDEIANLTGEFIHKLSTGGYSKSFEAILENYGANNIAVKRFIDKIFKSWDENSGKKKKKPMIKPRDVLKMNEES